jgi:hypothetical protein
MTQDEARAPIEISSQLIYCPRVSEAGGEALWECLRSLHLQLRPWSADSYSISHDAVREACARGERLVTMIGDDEWIVSWDQEVGSVGISGDLPFDGSRTREAVRDLLRVLDSLVRWLAPSFGWADLHDDYPEGLIEDVLETRIGWVFWINYYGAAYTERLGKDVFLAAPFESVEDLGSGVRCMTATTPSRLDAAQLVALRRHLGPAAHNLRSYGS